jgi:DNA invertase Pin-like site-specific DNA recombinase
MNAVRAPAPGPCIAYTRVSKEDQARQEKASLTQQRDAVTVLAKRLGVTVGEVFTDPGRSGDGVEQRPAFKALLQYCEQHPQPRGRPGYVLVLNDSRWGRFTADPEEATYWRVHLNKHGWIVRFAEGDSGDSSVRPMERAMHQLTASQYLVNVKANAKRGARGTAAKGYWCNEAPLGYRRITVGGTRPGTVLDVGQLKTKDEQVKLTLGPESERRIVRYIFERYDSGATSLGILVRELKKRWPGVLKWSRPVVRQILTRPAYCGDVVWMVRSNGPRDGDPVHVQDAHPALIKRVLWDRVQARLKANRRETRPTAGGYPLRELITCSECGAPYTGSGGPRGPDNEPDRYRFYRERPSDKKCGDRQGTLQKRIIEPAVISAVAKVVGHPKVQRLVAEALDRLLAGVPDTRKALAKEREGLEAQIKRIVERVGQGLIEDSEARPVLADLRGKRDALAAESDRVKFTAANRKGLAADRERLLGMAKDFATRARTLSGSALRDLLRPWLAGATFDKRTRTITLTIRQVPFTNLISGPVRG